MTLDEIRSLVEGFAPEIARAIDARLQPIVAGVETLRRENAELRRRLDDIEAVQQQAGRDNL